MMKKTMYWILTVVMVMQSTSPLGWIPMLETRVEATYLQNDNAGTFELSFLNPEGIVYREGLTVTGGVLFLSEHALSGIFLTTQVEPASIRHRNTISLDTTTPSGSKFFVTLLDCEQDVIVPGWEHVAYEGQPFSLAAIDKSQYACLQLQVDVQRDSTSSPSPIISKVAIEYQPYPVLISRVTAVTPKAEACGNVKYQVNFTNNYVNDMGVVLYVPLPRAEAGTITGYDESLDLYPRLNPLFVSAEGGGKYTTTGIIVNNKEVPAESVYRDIGVLNAGETRMYGFTTTVPCDTMNDTKYLVNSRIMGVLADPYISPQAETIIYAQARPKLTKGASGVFSYASRNYIYLPYNSTLTYTLTASNPQGTEPINKPIITDDLSDLQQKFTTVCGSGADLLPLVERISAISDGGILSGTLLTWNLANIGRNQTKSVSYAVDFTGCNVHGSQFNNTAQLHAKNISTVSASYAIQLLNLLSPGVQYFKTLLNNGALYYGDIVTYQLHLTNIGPVRLEDIHFDDVLPPELELVSADIVSKQGGSVTVSGTDITFDFSGCINSQYFATPAISRCYGNPSFATATIKAKIKTPVDACKVTTISNTASYDISRVSSTYYNDDVSMTGVTIHGEGTKVFPANPLKGSLSISLAGPSTLQVKQKGSYSITVANGGRDASLDTTLTILVPKLMVNGVEKYVSIINVEGGVIDYSDISQGKIYIHLEEILEGRSKSVKF
ncbi:MAG: DUF11 domain-containing protein [Candidatus Peribacteria bacterium]|jgi:uncharacterized repeat protein (TIGR01451 family)|nr:DUF11 domain-containing protein [Candidatus Peribacteria bacterium]